MSVFNKNKSRNMKPLGSDKWIPCNQYHRIDDKVPSVDGSRHEVQNPQLIGMTCDCKKLIYSEGECGCPGTDNRWEIKWQPNPNY